MRSAIGWLQRDPIGYADGMNLYEYVRSNPLYWTDWTGWGPYRLGSQPPLHPEHDPGAGAWGSKSPATEADRNSWNQWMKITDRVAVWFGMHDASLHMKRYLSNLGTGYIIDARGMFTESPAAKRHFYRELNEAMRFAEGHAKKGSFNIVAQKYTGGRNKKSESWNWYYAVGGYSAYGDGRVTPLVDCRYRMNFTFHFDDMYNWDPGKVVSIPGIGVVSDTTLGQLHLAGLAREFHMTGRYTKTVTWNKGDQFNVSTGELEPPGGR